MFQTNSRIERSEKGISFYEQDILCSSYMFEGNQVIDLRVDYLYSGLGIVIAEDNGRSFREADHVYLFKLGSNDFHVIEKHILSQSTTVENACIFSPSKMNQNARLVFTIKGKKVSFDMIAKNTDTGKDERRNLGKYEFKKSLGRYRIGFYSNAGNTIRNISFMSGVPEHWRTSIENTHGGRISFFVDGFQFEKCKNDAELEQDEVRLKPGTYFLDYKHEPVDGKYDIDGYVFKSKMSEVTDNELEDDKKNILDGHGKFVLKEETLVNVKFNGTSGKVYDVCIKDDPKSSFVETKGEVVIIDGSYILIHTDNLSEIRWIGTVFDAPPYDDYTKPCPYAIIETKNQKLSKEKACIDLGQEYSFKFNVASSILSTTQDKAEISAQHIDVRDEDQNRIIIFHNVKATIRELIIVDKKGHETNVILQKTFKKFVPATIGGPIIITDTSFDSLDISSSYREVVTPSWKIELFPKNREIQIQESIVNALENIEVYGIPKGAAVTMGETEIEKYASAFSRITSEYFSFETDVVVLDDVIRDKYEYVAVRYKSCKDFTYVFTNYEREVFDSKDRILTTNGLADVNEGVVIYGIRNASELKREYLYRVPADNMINSIDLCAEKYDMIPESLFEVVFENNEIKVDDKVKKIYELFVIDYLKRDSYAINYVDEYAQYEVDISTEADKLLLNYDMNDDGSVNEFKRTGIKPDRNKYIVLRRKAGEFE